jgi:hypothetical protein
VQVGPRISSAPRRKSGALRSIRGTHPQPCSNFKHAFALAARCARAVHLIFRPKRAQGTPDARCTRSPLCNVESTGVEATGTPEHPASPAQWFYGLCRALPGDRALLPPSSRGLRFCHCPVGPIKPPQDLTPASGRQDHTILPSATASLVRVLVIAHRLLENPPCNPAARSTLPRPSHPAPNVRDDHDTPLLWDGIRKVLEMIWGVWKGKYFLQRGLDTPVNKPPDGQIT